MKIVLKRRKHRNGVRPTRKGTLKVRMEKLLTREQHHKTINKLMDELHPLMIKGIESGLNAWENRHAGWLFYSIKELKKGYNYFEDFNQIDPSKLALKAINEVNPIFVGKRESVCNTCERKNDCPFTDKPKHMLDMICPIMRRAYVNTLMKVYNGEPTDTPLTQLDMANLAVKHLS